MSSPTRTSRRSVLATGVAVLGALAGCTEESTSGSPSLMNDDNADGTSTSRADDLDLREANVVAVAIETEEDGSYLFEVTLYHDDDGEDGYADWWQVERLDGTQLGRRTLRHAHSTAPFTRSTTVEIPDDIDRVVVRGHDQEHDYGGQAAVVSLDDGETQFIRQGSQRDRIGSDMFPGDVLKLYGRSRKN
ncbi:MAG: hypothetical protein V5A34_08625 [Halapricum sp.]